MISVAPGRWRGGGIIASSGLGKVLIEADGKGSPAPRRRVGGRLAALAAASFLAGLAVSAWPVIGDRTMALLASMGEARLEAIRAMEEPLAGPDGVVRSDWLVFFESGATEAERGRLLARHESVRFVEDTFFSNGVVVSILEPATDAVDALRASPAVWLVLRDRLFYLCH